MIYADEILKKDNSEAPKLSDHTVATITGVTIGLIAGAMYAYFNEKKYLPYIIGGGVAGGVILRVSLIKK